MKRFQDGEVNVERLDAVRGVDVFVLQPLCRSLEGEMQSREAALAIAVWVDAVGHYGYGCSCLEAVPKTLF